MLASLSWLVYGCANAMLFVGRCWLLAGGVEVVVRVDGVGVLDVFVINGPLSLLLL